MLDSDYESPEACSLISSIYGQITCHMLASTVNDGQALRNADLQPDRVLYSLGVLIRPLTWS